MRAIRSYWKITVPVFVLVIAVVPVWMASSRDNLSYTMAAERRDPPADPPQVSPPGGPLTENEKKGFDIYSKQCFVCHDNDAEGDGPMHTMFVPEPANLTLINDAPDMLYSIVVKNGIQGTMMPAHEDFTRDDFNNIMAYIRKQPIDTTREYAMPWGLKGKPAPAGMGRDTYITDCAGCHGINGDGKGTYFQDSYTWPKPVNFHARNSQIGRTYSLVYNGIPGTMMPAQADKLPEVAMWAVAQYVTAMYDGKSSFKIPSGDLDQHNNPFRRTQTDIVSEGKNAAGLYCAYCHGGEVDGTLIAPALDDRKWLFGGGTDTAIFDVVEQGVPGKLMPPHSPLPEDLRWKIITYIRDRGGMTDPLAATLSPPGGQQVEVTMQGLVFRPSGVIINPGDQVRWTNKDETAHTTTSNSWKDDRPAEAQPYQWDSDILDPGGSFARTFDKPGVYMYICDIHPFMVGYVAVNPAK